MPNPGLNYITILNEELVEVTCTFWRHTPHGTCNIQFNFNKIPAGQNYICLCNMDTKNYNRLFLAGYDRHYRVKATRELNRNGLVGLDWIGLEEEEDDENKEVDEEEFNEE